MIVSSNKITLTQEKSQKSYAQIIFPNTANLLIIANPNTPVLKILPKCHLN
jgi:hypothetical protein